MTPPNTGSWSGTRRSFTRAARQAILERDPICRICHTQPSTIADHTHPVAEAGPTNNPNAGQGVCQACHDQKTKAERQRGQHRRRQRLAPTTDPHPGLRR